MGKTRKGFDDSLTWIVLFIFLAIALNAFTQFDLHPWFATILMIFAGAGLMFEGKITTIKNWAKDGVQKPEVAYLFTIIFGMIMIVVGILAMPIINITSDKVDFVIGLASVISIIFIAVQKWWLN